MATLPWQRLWVILAARGILRPSGPSRRHSTPISGTVVARPARRRSAARAELTFGIEIECYVPHGSLPHGSEIQIATENGGTAAWKVKYDGSLSRAPQGYDGVEVVSPILSGADGVRQVIAICNRTTALTTGLFRK